MLLLLLLSKKRDTKGSGYDTHEKGTFKIIVNMWNTLPFMLYTILTMHVCEYVGTNIQDQSS